MDSLTVLLQLRRPFLNSVCPVTAKEAVYELSAGPAVAKEAGCEPSDCLLTATEVIVNLSVLFVPAQP